MSHVTQVRKHYQKEYLKNVSPLDALTQANTVCCHVLQQCAAVCCSSVLRCVAAVCCRVLQ